MKQIVSPDASHPICVIDTNGVVVLPACAAASGSEQQMLDAATKAAIDPTRRIGNWSLRNRTLKLLDLDKLLTPFIDLMVRFPAV
jgi:hypothetical protein